MKHKNTDEMGKKCLTIDLAQLEIVNHLTPMKAGVLIKAVANYCLTGVVAPWGEDADLEPIFMMMKANIERRSQSARERIMKRWHRNDTNDTNDTIVCLVSVQENESDKEKVAQKERGKVKELYKENLTEKKVNENEKTKEIAQADLFRGEAQAKAEPEGSVRPGGDADGRPRFKKPSVAEVAEYVRKKGYEQWVDAEAFWSYHENRDWKVGNHKMKSWHLAVTTWMRNSRTRQPQPRRGFGTSVGERAYNMLHFEYEGHPEMWEEERRKVQELQKDI